MARWKTRGAAVLVLALLLPLGTAWADPGQLIPREVIFGNPDRAGVQLSPDGSKISWLAAVDGVLNVWVAPAGKPEAAKPVTKDEKRGIRIYFWTYAGDYLVYLQDKGGDENWRAYSVNVETLAEKDLTPYEGVRAQINGVSQKIPGEILVGLNDRDKRYHDVYRIDLKTGERTLVQENPGVLGYVTDDDYNVRMAAKFEADGSMVMQKNDGGEWSDFLKVGPEDNLTTSPVGFDKSGKKLYFIDSRGRNTAALKTIDVDSGAAELVAEDDLADIAGVMTHPTEYHAQAVRVNYDRARWKILDDSIQGDFDYLEAVDDGDFVVTSRTHDDKTWIVAFFDDNGPVRYYRYDRKKKKASYLFSNRKSLEGVELAAMHPKVLDSRDGLKLVSYLSLPPWSDEDGDGKPAERLPMVLFVHGGPWARDSWGYHPYHQWLANRGYAVLSVNYRGSTGFGKNFVNAADKQWSKKMHDDLIDAVDWAIGEGIADPEKVAIAGGSYGGYATLVGVTFTPEKFACGVDIVGPSSLLTLINNVPPYWRPFLPALVQRVGDHKTLEGRRFLRSVSPLTHVEEIVRPLLIGQGANDPRVKQSESDQIVEAMLKKELPVTYVLYPDEGHGFARPENRLSFNAVSEAFLSQHLGGRFEPIGDDFENSSIQVPTGSEHIPGLAEEMMTRPVTVEPDTGP